MIFPPLPESIREVVDACFPQSYEGQPTTEEWRKSVVNAGIRIDVSQYLAVVDRDFFKDEDPDYQHIPQDQSDSLKRPTQFRNFTGSAADAPACISYGEWLMFANQADLRDKVMARARKYLTNVVLPSLDAIGDSKMMADYYLQHGIYNAFYISYRFEVISMHWLSAVGLHYPEKLKQECEKVLDYINTKFYEDRTRIKAMRSISKQDFINSAYPFVSEFIERLLKHFGVK
ncbi:MAG: hypothetical protein Q4G39_05645 [Brachymonas sp.]|nr:hypothetical protein [Brachymonas sp.]